MVLAARFHGFYEYLHLIRFFFKTAMQRMQEEMDQKEANTKRFMTFLF